MKRFVMPFVVPIIKRRRWTRLCEIGASHGEATDRLRRSSPDLLITVIDPCIDTNLEQKYADDKRIEVKKGLSLEVLQSLSEPYNCILIDGDHNWYTVYNELKVISERSLLCKGGVIFFHDVDWPWARRDMYYQPEAIPIQFQHKWEQQGVVRGQDQLSADGRFGDLKIATHEGGAKNGVLTAIEDFLKEHEGKYRFFRVPVGGGLGVLLYRDSHRGDLSYFSLLCKGLICRAVYPVARAVRASLR